MSRPRRSRLAARPSVLTCAIAVAGVVAAAVHASSEDVIPGPTPLPDAPVSSVAGSPGFDVPASDVADGRSRRPVASTPSEGIPVEGFAADLMPRSRPATPGRHRVESFIEAAVGASLTAHETRKLALARAAIAARRGSVFVATTKSLAPVPVPLAADPVSGVGVTACVQLRGDAAMTDAERAKLAAGPRGSEAGPLDAPDGEDR